MKTVMFVTSQTIL